MCLIMVYLEQIRKEGKHWVGLNLMKKSKRERGKTGMKLEEVQSKANTPLANEHSLFQP